MCCGKGRGPKHFEYSEQIPEVDRTPGVPCTLQNMSRVLLRKLKFSCSVGPGTRSGITIVAAAVTAVLATLSTKRVKASASSVSSTTILEATVINAITSLETGTKTGIVKSVAGVGVDILKYR